MPGYWWECEVDPGHQEVNFSEAAGGLRLVDFFFDLASRDWNQNRLSPPCRQCDGAMRINYAFPRGVNPLQFAVHHVVGLDQDVDGGHYLPMLWESTARGETVRKFDLKFVRKDSQGHRLAQGLSRPAIVSASDWAEMAALYRRVVDRGFPLRSH